jgi:hypothetical protein
MFLKYSPLIQFILLISKNAGALTILVPSNRSINSSIDNISLLSFAVHPKRATKLRTASG